MPLHLITLLALVLGISALIALIDTKETPTRVSAGLLIMIAAWLGAGPHVAFIAQHTTSLVAGILAVAVCALGIITGIRTAKPAITTLLIAGGVLVAALQFGLVVN